MKLMISGLKLSLKVQCTAQSLKNLSRGSPFLLLIKHKKMHTEEFKVTGVKTDKRGHGKFVVETLPNVFVDVSWKLLMRRNSILLSILKSLSETLTVQFQKMTRKGSLQFCWASYSRLRIKVVDIEICEYTEQHEPTVPPASLKSLLRGF